MISSTVVGLKRTLQSKVKKYGREVESAKRTANLWNTYNNITDEDREGGLRRAAWDERGAEFCVQVMQEALDKVEAYIKKYRVS